MSTRVRVFGTATWVIGLITLSYLSTLPGFQPYVGLAILLWLGITFAVIVVSSLWGFVRGVIEGAAQQERRYRMQHGMCFSCGYKLRGNVSGICPECGTPAAECPAEARM